MANYTPRGLGNEGGKFWRNVTSKYTLRVDELVTLEAACRTLDLIKTLEADWIEDGKPTMTTGSQGQNVIDPRVAEMKAQRLAFEAFAKRLALPDDVAPGSGVKPNQQRAAGQSRWTAAHGNAG